MLWVKILSAFLHAAVAVIALVRDVVAPPFRNILFVMAVVLFMLSSWEAWEEYQVKRSVAPVGTLSPQRHLFHKFLVGDTGSITLRMGDSETFFKMVGKDWWPNPVNFTEPVLVFGGPEPEYGIYMWQEGGELRMRMKIHNREGDLVAEIDGNRWFVKRELLYDLNFDDEAIEVRNSEGQIQLQVVYFENLIQLSYFDFDRNGGWAVIHASTESFPKDEAPREHITPLFKYPSLSYPGVRL